MNTTFVSYHSSPVIIHLPWRFYCSPSYSLLILISDEHPIAIGLAMDARAIDLTFTGRRGALPNIQDIEGLARSLNSGPSLMNNAQLRGAPLDYST
jgi:hypothetical protein